MRKLFLQFLKKGGFILFLFLEAICMVLIVQNNEEQRKILLSSSNRFSGFVYDQANEVSKFYNLYAVADSMARENARLYNQLDNAKLKRSPWRDTFVNEETSQMYTFIPAHIISNSINRHNNMITLDIGKDKGVKQGMGVVSDNGVVGVITAVTGNFASVMSVLHKETRISASLKRSGHFGFLTWKKSNPLYASMVDVPKHASVQVGDTVITSGYSTMFPRDIMIGMVDTFAIKSGGNSWDIDLKLSNDLTNVRFVYVINNLKKIELEELEKAANE